MISCKKIEDLLEPDIYKVLDRSIKNTDELIKELNIMTSTKQKSQVLPDETQEKSTTVENTNLKMKNTNNNKRSAPTSDVERPQKMAKVSKPIIHLSYVTGKIIDSNLKKSDMFKYRISSSGRFRAERRSRYPDRKQMKISFENTSFTISRPEIINDIRASVQATMKKYLKNEEFKAIYYTDSSTFMESKTQRDDHIKYESKDDIMTPKNEPKYVDDIVGKSSNEDYKSKNTLGPKIVMLSYPQF